jgi:hypothetical protein
MELSLMIIIIFLIISCDNSVTKMKEEKNFTPKKEFQLIDYKKSNDTILFVICSEYVYYPFGNLQKSSNLSDSFLKNFRITNKDSLQGTELINLELDSNQIKIYFNNSNEGSIHSYIFDGTIKNNKVKFVNETRIGIDKYKFIHQFFHTFDEDLLKESRVIIFESCVRDIEHIYNFKNDTLTSLIFKTDTHF